MLAGVVALERIGRHSDLLSVSPIVIEIRLHRVSDKGGPPKPLQTSLAEYPTAKNDPITVPDVSGNLHQALQSRIYALWVCLTSHSQ